MLKVGDKIRIVDIPGNGNPNGFLHAQARRVYKKIMARNRPVRIDRIVKQGTPWFTCRFRRKDGVMEHHFLAVCAGDHDWKPVAARQGRKA